MDKNSNSNENDRFSSENSGFAKNDNSLMPESDLVSEEEQETCILDTHAASEVLVGENCSICSDSLHPLMHKGPGSKSFLTPAQAARLPDGTQPLAIGSGVITGILGEGGMARVYKVWNQKLEIFRAVKVVFPTENPELTARFETEIKISAKLHHPNIVETYVVGEWNGLPYIEMELVEGLSLERYIKQLKNISPIVLAAIGIQMASALAYAHTEKFLLYGKTYNGIIHRDLKPGNIIIGKNGRVKLMDFGIARPSEVQLHTVSGYIVGTLPYLSPEQIEETEIDHRSDIYSMGTILYEALTGEKTFPQQTIPNLMHMKVVHSYRKIETYGFGISPELIKIVEKCLYYDKKKRFQTSKDLENALRDVFCQICDESADTVLRKFVEDPLKFSSVPDTSKTSTKKYRFFLTISIAALICLIAGVWGRFLLLNQPVRKKAGVSLRENAQPDFGSNPVMTNDTVRESYPDTTILYKNDSISGTTVGKSRTSVKKETAVVGTVKKTSKKSEPGETVAVLSPVEKLKIKYGLTDVVDVADAVSKKGEWNNVVTLINAMEQNNPDKNKGYLLLVLAYVELGLGERASKLLNSFTSDDAFYVLLEGRVAIIQGQDKMALNKFEEAMTRPGQFRTTQQVRNDALYYTAIVYDNRFNATRTPEARQQAMIAWNSLKKAYLSQPEHQRFKLANEKLSGF